MSSIILTARYRIVKNLKVEVSKWLNYVDDKDKADPCTLNKENSLIDEIGEFDDCTFGIMKEMYPKKMLKIA